MRIVFMGTPPLVVPILEQLHQKWKVVGVYTQPDRPSGRGLQPQFSAVKQKAIQLGLPVHQPLRLSQPGEWDVLAAYQPDVIVVAAYGQILKKNVLDLPSLVCMNVHFSLLPRWRGAAPIHWALLQGDSETGITTMRMSEKCDEGAILLQERIQLSSQSTFQTIQTQLSQMAPALVFRTLRSLELGECPDQVQDSSQVTWAPKVSSKLGLFRPSQSALELDRLVRALSPSPGAGFRVQGSFLKVRKACLPEEGFSESYSFGAPHSTGFLFQRGGRLFLRTPQKDLELLSVQWEGKKEGGVLGFLNGIRGSGKSPLPWPIEWPTEPEEGSL